MPSSAHQQSATPVAAWIEAAQNGSREALGRLLEQFRPYLLRLANSELDAQLQAKGSGSDLVQETFLEVQRIFGRFQGTSSADLLAWLHAILQNKVATFTRHYRATAKRRIALEVALDPSAERDGRSELGLEAREPSPSHRLIHDEQAASLNRALERLPADYRQVIHWRQWEELSYDEIARRLNRSVDAARMLWWRTIERLHKELQPSA